MVQPAPRIITAPVKNKADVATTVTGVAPTYGAAIKVENKHGKKR